MTKEKLSGTRLHTIIVDDPLADFKRAPNPWKERYGCPADTKLIPFLIDGICRHWYLLTGETS